jgi:hypothetical protein
MAILIEPDNANGPCKLTTVEPKNGNDFDLEELREFMAGGYIDVVHLSSEYLMVVDDEGFRKELPLNTVATAVYLTFRTGSNNQIVGPALVCKRKEIE